MILCMYYTSGHGGTAKEVKFINYTSIQTVRIVKTSIKNKSSRSVHACMCQQLKLYSIRNSYMPGM